LIRMKSIQMVAVGVSNFGLWLSERLLQLD
jgi:hypothetical protein